MFSTNCTQRRACPATAVAIGSALLAAGCQTAPAPLQVPPRAPVVDYAAATRTDVGDALAVSAEVLAVAAPPRGDALLLAAATIAADRGEPFRGRSMLPVGALWLTAEDALAFQELRTTGDPSRVQSLGVTTAVVAPALVTSVQVDGTPLPSLQLSRSAAGVHTVAVTVGPDAVEQLTLADELVVGSAAGLFVPGSVGATGGYVWWIDVAGAAASDAVADANVRAAANAALPAGPPDRPAAWRTALAAVGADNRRPALLALLAPLALGRVVDLVLAADEAALIALTEALRPLDPTADGIAWRVERAAWQAILPRIERDDLTGALTAAALRQLGAVGGDPAQLAAILQGSADCGAFASALQDENVAALSDRSAAVRVHANAWLVARDLAIAAYDPLGDERARRRALRTHRARVATESSR